MMERSTSELSQILKSIESLYRGPGGATAILQDGEVVARHVWGFADLNRRIALSSQTVLPICSISKQMVCLVLVDLLQNPTSRMLAKKTDPRDLIHLELKNKLPHLFKDETCELTIANLYNMASGIRDYWAMTALWGARAEDPFVMVEDGPRCLERTRSFHFEPGTEYSYSNLNFYVLGRIIEDVSGHSLGQLLAERVFIPAGMPTAALCPRAEGHPLPCVGYEGDQKHGYTPAINRIEWSGDAGIVASLDDMVEYERYLDRSWSDPKSVYRAIAEPDKYKDGSPADYGHGLKHQEVAGKKTIRHGGALRGYRLQRCHVPSERLSVIVLFNHEADASAATDDIIKQMFKWQEPERATFAPSPKWHGNFLDPGTNLLISIEPGEEEGELRLSYDRSTEKIKLTDAIKAESLTMTVSIEDDTVMIHRLEENRKLYGRRLAVPQSKFPPSHLYNGVYSCSEAGSTFHCTGGSGGAMYGFFDGFMGRGPVQLMQYVGEDVWILFCPRGIDAPAPGNWTIVFHRDEQGQANRVTIGCWLARNLEYVREANGAADGKVPESIAIR